MAEVLWESKFPTKISINMNIFSQNPTDGIVPLLAIERG